MNCPSKLNFERTVPVILSEPSQSNRPRRNWFLCESSRSPLWRAILFCWVYILNFTVHISYFQIVKFVTYRIPLEPHSGLKKYKYDNERYIRWLKEQSDQRQHSLLLCSCMYSFTCTVTNLWRGCFIFSFCLILSEIPHFWAMVKH